jgi:putative CocE/NonD family hydrolase
VLLALLCALGAHAAVAHASVVEQGYLTLSDGTRLGYTLTRPSTAGRWPVVLKYDPYSAGVTSDPTWNDSGYAMLGVNFRGTGCSQGAFDPLRADLWGKDGAEVVAWAARQPWSTGSIGMIGYSFTGVSQYATAAFAGPALKAIAPGNAFPDFYRDLIYPGGILNSWIPGWIAARNFLPGLGGEAFQHAASDADCAASQAQQAGPDYSQTPNPALHPYRDDAYWSHAPERYLDRVHVPVLGCVNWQDTTVYSRSFNELRDQLDPATTWIVGANGTHIDCPMSRPRLVRFFDRYVKGEQNGWEANPHILLVHELTVPEGAREKLPDDAGSWRTSVAQWSDLDTALEPVRLYLREGGRLALSAPTGAESPDTYRYPTRSANSPADFGGNSSWNNPAVPGTSLVYTTPVLTSDAEFLGSGSADLWLSSTAPDTDVQVTLSEIRPDGQEMYVMNGWLRMSHRHLDGRHSTALRPAHTFAEADVEPLVPATPVLARIELQPFDHVFRAGSAIRLSIDAPGSFFGIVPVPAVNTIYHERGMDSKLALGWLPGQRAQAPLPACGAVLNQPCRANSEPVPAASMTISRSSSCRARTRTRTRGSVRARATARCSRTAAARSQGRPSARRGHGR